MTAHQQNVIEYFDQTHNDYRLLWGIDRHFGLHCGFSDEQHRQHDAAVLHMNCVLATMAGIRRGEHVLDAGCGIGGSAVWLAENAGAYVVGVNINANQVRTAQGITNRRRLENRVRFHIADFCATSLPAESFDVVWALESVCYAEDQRAFLVEAFRLLKPGGRVIIADAFLTRENLDARESQIVSRWQQGWAIGGTASVDQFAAWLRDAGFGSVHFRDVTQHVAASSQRIYRATLLFYPLAYLLYRLGLRTVIQTRGIESGYYQYHARRRGLGMYGIFLAGK